MRRVKRGIAVLCLLGLLAAAGCTPQETETSPRGVAFFNYFDTVSYVYSYAGDSAERFEERSAEVSSVLYEHHQLFDIYHEYAGVNNLATVNRLAGGEPVAVDERLVDFLLYARELYTLTGGEMNVMMGAVLSVWHDYRTEGKELPPREILEEAAKHTDISLLEIDEEKNTVRIADADASIDVGALGKGYATEVAARKLEAQGADSYVLNVGGNIRIIGQKPDGSGWRTGVKDPADPNNAYKAYLDLSDTSCVTSGNYERFYTVNNVRYHHIIDRDTLMPAEQFAGVTVLTKNSGLADALSTALFCMSYEDGLSVLERVEEDVAVLWIRADGEVLTTPNIEKWMETSTSK